MHGWGPASAGERSREDPPQDESGRPDPAELNPRQISRWTPPAYLSQRFHASLNSLFQNGVYHHGCIPKQPDSEKTGPCKATGSSIASHRPRLSLDQKDSGPRATPGKRLRRHISHARLADGIRVGLFPFAAATEGILSGIHHKRDTRRTCNASAETRCPLAAAPDWRASPDVGRGGPRPEAGEKEGERETGKAEAATGGRWEAGRADASTRRPHGANPKVYARGTAAAPRDCSQLKTLGFPADGKATSDRRAPEEPGPQQRSRRRSPCPHHIVLAEGVSSSTHLSE
ncbi:uncharacterized protein AKAME5_002478200 [Lates japonicus]|uniref:Uncharacterized protein n=1 Tax=Lates japonicus TaxID=270547 RepID=A0AAD3RM04_LATJO|nr:uncharacterized protein AKAME5_002478200 [Lates japonicus]